MKDSPGQHLMMEMAEIEWAEMSKGIHREKNKCRWLQFKNQQMLAIYFPLKNAKVLMPISTYI